MIKIKILNPKKGRNEVTFRPFLQAKNVLRDYSIDITDSDDYDYLFLGMQDFMDKKISLKDSIDFGLEAISKIDGDYFLFDGSDSTSMMGAYEVFTQSDAIYLFKNQLLMNRDDYKVPYAFNKFFFGSGSEIDLSYDITDDEWSRIKLTNINCARTVFGTGVTPYLDNMPPISNQKNIDLCAIFQAEHPENRDHGFRNDIYYTKHRKGLWDELEPLKEKYKMITQKMPFQEYIENLRNSKISLSPFGMGEICFRDFESILSGTIILKPNQSMVNSEPNVFVEGETYIGCEHDWSNLEEKIEYIIDNFNLLQEKINTNVRKMLKETCNYEYFCLHYYNIFSNLKDIKSYE